MKVKGNLKAKKPPRALDAVSARSDLLEPPAFPHDELCQGIAFAAGSYGPPCLLPAGAPPAADARR